MALGLLAYQLAGADAAAVLGTALAIKMIAYVAVAPVAAAHVDRFPRRLMLVSLDVIRAAVVVVVALVVVLVIPVLLVRWPPSLTPLWRG